MVVGGGGPRSQGGAAFDRSTFDDPFDDPFDPLFTVQSFKTYVVRVYIYIIYSSVSYGCCCCCCLLLSKNGSVCVCIYIPI